jgi:uncharacterized HAD superfamily protein
MAPYCCEIDGEVCSEAETCGHTAQQRNLTAEQQKIALNRELTEEEYDAIFNGGQKEKIIAGRKASMTLFGADHKLPPSAIPIE